MKRPLPAFLQRLRAVFLFAVLYLALAPGAFSQTSKDSKGTDFWLMFNTNYSTPTLTLFIASDVNTSGTVTIPGLSFSATFTVTANAITPITIPVAAEMHTSNVIDTKGIHVTALQEVTVYGLNYAQFTTDAYLGLPTDALGTEYIVMSYSGGSPSALGIVSTANGTVVTITPSVAVTGHAVGVPYNITLNQGQTYEVTGSDVTGTIIASTQPVGVMGANICANIPVGYSYCDHINEMLPPTSTWGKSFATVPLKSRSNGDTWRFLAAEDNTVISINGVARAAINRGKYLEMILTAQSVISSTKPILVAQFANGSDFSGNPGDPFMMLIPPLEQFLPKYTVTTVTGYAAHYINLIAPAAVVGTLTLDGVVVPLSSFTAIGSSGYRGAQLTVAQGVHNLAAALPFGVFVYGFNTDDSYGYPGGQAFGDIRFLQKVALTPKTGINSVGSEQCYDAFVTDQNGLAISSVVVTFNIKGANSASSGTAVTNTGGIAHFCYTGANVGQDSIIAIASDKRDTSTFTWTSRPVPLYYSKSAGDLHNTATWGVNPDGSGANPPDFTAGKTFILANRVINYTMTANWTVGGILSIPSTGLLQIGNYTLSVADLAGAGSLSGTMSSNLTVTQPSIGTTTLNFVSAANNLNNLMVSSGALTTLGTDLNVYGVLTAMNGTFNTAGMLTLKSTAANTARVAPVTGTVTGMVTVERYIPARRAWRIMSAPVGGSQTMNTAWQEGATTSSPTPNPVPGYGTHITEGSDAAGLDHNPLTAMSSLKRYNSATDTWASVLNTYTSSVNSDAYMLFVRGDRSIPLGLNTVPANNTTLRARGPLKTGDQNFPVSATGFTAIPNPFASPINFATLTRSNVQNNFYLWDPKMGGEFGVGGYVLLSYNGAGYDVIPASVSPESQYIQSGQGFLVRSTGVAGTLTIKEGDKSTTPAADVFRVGSTAPVAAGLRVNLQAINSNNTTSLLDEVFSSYGSSFSDKVDALDAYKVANIEENLAIVRESQVLMVDRSKALDEDDVIKLRLWNTSAKGYLLEFNPVNLVGNISVAYLLDNYLKTTTRIDLNKVSQLYFTVTADTASASQDRFTVVFKSPDAALATGKSNVVSYPNPVRGKIIQLLFNDQPQGTYKVELVNGLGQVIYQTQLNHAGGSAIRQLELASKPAMGVYMLNVTNRSTKNNIKVVVE